MRLGLAIPQYGSFADPESTVTVAKAAEEIGYHSLWVGDRILAPLDPRDPFPAGDGVMPIEHHTFLDPLTTLTVAAAATSRVRLGTSTLNALWHTPVMLARTITTLDHVSHGRLDIGIGLGWSRDEYQAVNVDWTNRGARLDEMLDVLETIWTCDTVKHAGEQWTIPASRIEPKPAQHPRPPILLAGFTPNALRRIGSRADGWLALGMPVSVLDDMWARIRSAATSAKRDPDQLRMVVRINPQITTNRAAAEDVPDRGSVQQIADYALLTHQHGAQEVLLDLQRTARTTDELIDQAEAVFASCTSRSFGGVDEPAAEAL
jgi:probable F420-dependent oxidoreductase